MPENIERASLAYENLSQEFSREVADYTKQYCSIYLIRLKQMTKLLETRIEQKWGQAYPVIKLHKLSELDQLKCIVIGTLFKDQKLKPSILKQLAEGNNLVPQPIVTHFTDKSDQLYVEDELQRYELLGEMDRDHLVTGISVALLGTDDGRGKFTVEDYIFADFRPQVERPLPSDDAFVVFISGLDLVHSQDFAPNLQLFVYWLYGLVGDLGDNITASKVARVVLAGNGVRNMAERVKPSISMLSRNPETSDTIEAVRLLDKFLLQLAKVIDVDVMPGENDPSNHVLPQRPMHFCMFPDSSCYKSAHHVTNPYAFSLAGTRVLGTSGQPVRDVMRFSEVPDALAALEGCLRWSHLAPTAPDTLGCYPFYDRDPFIIEQCPHVMFAANQSEFATKEVTGPEGQKVRLISVPEFSTTLQACILNVRTLEATSVEFKTL